MKELHVLLVTSLYPPAHAGGQLRVHRTYQRMKSRWPVRLNVLTRDKNVSRSGRDRVDGVPVYRLRSRTHFLLQFLHVGCYVYCSQRRSVDVIHFLGTHKFVLAGAIWAKSFGIPYMFEMTKTPKTSLSNSGLRPCVLRQVINGASLMVSINHMITNEIEEAEIDPDRIWTRPNPISTKTFHPPVEDTRREARNQFDVSPSDTVHLLIGEFSPRKNQRFALQVLQGLPDHHHLILAGPVIHHASYFREVRELCSKKQIDQRVVFLDEYVEDVRSLYDAADCCWIPSTREGLPNVLLEALCCGVPVIANRDLGLSHHIVDGENGRNVSLDVSSFQDAVQQLEPLIKDAERRTEIARQAKDRYRASALDRQFYERIQSIANETETPVG